MVFSSNELDVLILQNGDDGTPVDSKYTWVKYSKNPDGSDLTDNPDGAIYMGFAYNQESINESNNPADYTWIKIQGEQGKDGYTIILQNENVSFSVSPQNIALSDQQYETTVTVAQGTEIIDNFVIGEAVGNNGITVTKQNKIIVLSVKKGVKILSDTGFVRVPIAINGSIFYKDITWSVSKQGADGESGSPALNIVMGNEAQNIPCSDTGLTLDNFLISIPFSGYIGFNKTPCSAIVGLLPSGITLGENTASTESDDGMIVLNVAKDSDLGNPNILTGDINIVFQINEHSFSKKFIWSKTKDGGTSTLYTIEPSTYVVTKDYDDALSPASVVFKSYYQEHGINRQLYDGLFIVEESTDNVTYKNKYLSSKAENTIEYIPSSNDVVSIRCSLCKADDISSILDRQTIAILSNMENLKPIITEITTTLKGVSSEVDAVNQKITDKVWQSDITESINHYDGNTVKTIRDQVAKQEVELGEITTEVSDVKSTFSEGMTTLEKKVAKVEQNAEGFQQTVENTYATKTEVDNIQVGGRNLALDTSKERIELRNCNYLIAPVAYEKGVYTVSFYAKASTTGQAIVYINDDTGQSRYGFSFGSIVLTTSYQKFVLTSQKNAGYSGAVDSIFIRIYGSSENIKCSVKNLKLEFGNKATDWTPAIEDQYVGVRNLLKPELGETGSHGTKKDYECSFNITGTSTPDTYFYLKTYSPLELNEAYTLSFKVSGIPKGQPEFGIDGFIDKLIIKNGFNKCTFYWKNKINNGKGILIDNVGQFTAAYTGTLKFYDIQLEKGSIATDFSPAPESVGEEISSVKSELKQTADEIDLSVKNIKGDVSNLNVSLGKIEQKVTDATGKISSLTTDVNGIRGTVSDNKGNIASLTTTVNGINSTVTSHGESISKIDQKAESILQQVTNINNDLSTKIEQTKDKVEITANKIDEMKIGGRNLARKDVLKVYSSYASFSFKGHDINLSASSGSITSAPGFYIDSKVFELTKKYVLSFDITVNSGTISTIGGESNSFTTNKTIIDGISIDGSWNSGKTTNWSSGKHRVEVYLTNKSTGVKHLYIQPNRNANSFTPYSATISNLQLETGTICTDWTPAPEDIENTLANNYYNKTETDSKFEVQSNGITMAVTKEVTSQMGNLQIGGRNLQRNSGFNSGWSYWTTHTADYTIDTSKKLENVNSVKWTRTSASSGSVYLYDSGHSTKISPSKTYTVSAWFYCDTIPTGSMQLQQYFYTASNTVSANYSIDIKFVAKKWTRMSLTNVAPTNADSCQIVFDLRGAGTCWIACPKTEEGSKPTAWSPAIEDTVNGLKYVNAKNSYNQTQIENYCKDGSTHVWDLTSNTTGISVGDTVAVKIGNTTTGSYTHLVGEVTDVPSTTSLRVTSRNMMDLKAGTVANDVKNNLANNYFTKEQTKSEIEVKTGEIVTRVSSTVDYVDSVKKNYGYRYKYDITINGDSNKYYPVILRGGNQDVMREVFVNRGYSEKAPTEWNGHPTNKGIALTLKIKCNFGGWGGSTYDWRIHDLKETYGNVFAGAVTCMSYIGFAIFLRGGGSTGAIYHIYSDQILENTVYGATSPKVWYNGGKDLIGYSGETYKWYAPEPRTLTTAVKKEIASKIYIEVADSAKKEAENAQSSADDANAAANDAVSRITVAESTIKQLSDSIAMMVTDKNGSSLMTQTSNGWTFNIGAITDSLNKTASDLSSLSGNVTSLDSTLKNLNNTINDLGKKTAYINLTTDDSGNPCIELGKIGNAFKVRITNTSVDFMQGSSKIAYVNNQSLYIERAIIKDELQIGEGTGFVWKRRSNGNMGLRWEG